MKVRYFFTLVMSLTAGFPPLVALHQSDKLLFVLSALSARLSNSSIFEGDSKHVVFINFCVAKTAFSGIFTFVAAKGQNEVMIS